MHGRDAKEESKIERERERERWGIIRRKVAKTVRETTHPDVEWKDTGQGNYQQMKHSNFAVRIIFCSYYDKERRYHSTRIASAQQKYK